MLTGSLQETDGLLGTQVHHGREFEGRGKLDSRAMVRCRKSVGSWTVCARYAGAGLRAQVRMMWVASTVLSQIWIRTEGSLNGFQPIAPESGSLCEIAGEALKIDYGGRSSVLGFTCAVLI